MVTKLPAGHRTERNTAFLVGSFLKAFNFFRLFVRDFLRFGCRGKFRGLPQAGVSARMRSWAVQIFDNLVGCTRNIRQRL
jgi:hypothetical protein